MENDLSADRATNPRVSQTGGLHLGEDRLKIALHQWEVIHRSIRVMDALELGETEPATVYLWEERP